MLRRDRGDGRGPVDVRRALGPALAGAVAVAPLLGLLYGRWFGFGTLLVALGATIVVAVRSAPAVPAVARTRLRALVAINVAILAVAALLVVLALL